MTDTLKIGLVDTPETWDDIIAFTQGANTPADAATAACMAWNFSVEWHRKLDKCTDKIRLLEGVDLDDLIAWIAMREAMEDEA